MVQKTCSFIHLRQGNSPVAELDRKRVMQSCRLSQDPLPIPPPPPPPPIAYTSLHGHLSKKAWSDTQNEDDKKMLFFAYPYQED